MLSAWGPQSVAGIPGLLWELEIPFLDAVGLPLSRVAGPPRFCQPTWLK